MLEKRRVQILTAIVFLLFYFAIGFTPTNTVASEASPEGDPPKLTTIPAYGGVSEGDSSAFPNSERSAFTSASSFPITCIPNAIGGPATRDISALMGLICAVTAASINWAARAEDSASRMYDSNLIILPAKGTSIFVMEDCCSEFIRRGATLASSARLSDFSCSVCCSSKPIISEFLLLAWTCARISAESQTSKMSTDARSTNRFDAPGFIQLVSSVTASPATPRVTIPAEQYPAISQREDSDINATISKLIARQVRSNNIVSVFLAIDIAALFLCVVSLIARGSKEWRRRKRTIPRSRAG